MNIRDEITIYYLIVLFGVTGLVISVTYNSASYTNGYNEAIKSCVEDPQECKETYQSFNFYQLFNLGGNK
jgi:hypothetical protein